MVRLRAVLARPPDRPLSSYFSDSNIMYDFRSDTVTRPTPEMMRAMASARVGDDVFGDDPAVHELEAYTADLLGKEAALFVTSGTMSNQLALRVHVGALDEVLCDARAHIVCWEVGAVHGAGAAVGVVVVKATPRRTRARAVARVARARTTRASPRPPTTRGSREMGKPRESTAPPGFPLLRPLQITQ